MDINTVISGFLVLSVAGYSLSIAAYSSFKDKASDDQKLLLIIAICFIFAFLVAFILSFTTLENLNFYQYLLALIFFVLIFMAIMSIIGFVIHRLMVDQKFKDDELKSAVIIIESSKDDLDSIINLLNLKNKIDKLKINLFQSMYHSNILVNLTDSYQFSKMKTC